MESYQLVAECLQAERDDWPTVETGWPNRVKGDRRAVERALDSVILRLARAFELDNPRFDRVRFADAARRSRDRWV